MKNLSLLLKGEHIGNVIIQKKVSAEERYKTAGAQRAIIKAVGDVSVSGFKEDFLRALYRNLNVNKTTKGIYFRTSKTVLSASIKRGYLKKEDYAFGKDGFTIPKSEGNKRALSEQEKNTLVKYARQ